MQGTIPPGGALAGFTLPLLGVPALVLVSAAFIGLPGMLGAFVPPLWRSATTASVRQGPSG